MLYEDQKLNFIRSSLAALTAVLKANLAENLALDPSSFGLTSHESKLLDTKSEAEIVAIVKKKKNNNRDKYDMLKMW
jgi:hypothetical protein